MRLPSSLLLLFSSSCLFTCLASLAHAQNAPQQTIIEGDNLVIESKADGRTVFVFSENVRIIGSNLLATCDRLEVLSQSKPGAATAKPVPTPLPGQLPLLPTKNNTPIGAIELITATGHVEILQGDRQSNSEKAEIFPNTKAPAVPGKLDAVGKIILSGSPRVKDGTSILSGGIITLYTGEGRIVVEPDKNDPKNTRPSVVLETPTGK